MSAAVPIKIDIDDDEPVAIKISSPPQKMSRTTAASRKKSSYTKKHPSKSMSSSKIEKKLRTNPSYDAAQAEDLRLFETDVEIELTRPPTSPAKVNLDSNYPLAVRAGEAWGMKLGVTERRVNASDGKVLKKTAFIGDGTDDEDEFPIVYVRDKMDDANTGDKGDTRIEHVVTVLKIGADSLAYKAGLRKGDVFVTVFGAPFASTEQLYHILENVTRLNVGVKRTECPTDMVARLQSNSKKQQEKKLTAAQIEGNTGVKAQSTAMEYESVSSRKRKKSSANLEPNTNRPPQKCQRKLANDVVMASSTSSKRFHSASISSNSSTSVSSPVSPNTNRRTRDTSETSNSFDAAQNAIKTSYSSHTDPLNLPSCWRKEKESYIHVPTNFRVKKSQFYIMPELLKVLEKPFCSISPKQAFKEICSLKRKSTPSSRSNTKSPKPTSNIRPPNVSVIAKIEPSVSINSTPRIVRPTLPSLSQNQLPKGWLTRSESSKYYSHQATGVQISSTYVMKIVIKLLQEYPSMPIKQAAQLARKQDSRDRDIYQQKIVKSKLCLSIDNLPKAWTHEISGGKRVFVHKGSGIKVFKPSHMPRILKLIEQGVPIIKAKQMAREGRQSKG